MTPGTTTTIIPVHGSTGAITTLGTTEDTAGVTVMIPGTTTAGTADGMGVSTILGTIAHGIPDSMTHTTITCTRTTADGTADGGLILEESIIGHIMEEDL